MSIPLPNGFGDLPLNAKSIEPFKLSVPETEVEEFRQLLKLSKINPPTWESSQEDRRYGVTTAWLAAAKDHWLNTFDWRSWEKHINSFPQFKATVSDEGQDFDVHFAALFSKRQDADRVIALHGWPGSFLEFLPIMSLAMHEYTPETLPYHFVVPSLPGYALSSSPDPSKPLTVDQSARILNNVMINLGFGSGYVASGGDVGSGLARILAAKHKSCKAMHLNFCPIMPPASIPISSLSEEDQEFVKRGKDFKDKGSAYAMEHGTRPSTISLVLSSNPLALLAWIGEKFLAWTDEDPSLDTILADVSLYWFTNTISSCFYSYRQTWNEGRPGHDGPELHVHKPFGYSLFPKELIVTPRSWVATTGDLSWFRQHESGGHFAALEKPKEMKQDIEEFLDHARNADVSGKATAS